MTVHARLRLGPAGHHARGRGHRARRRRRDHRRRLRLDEQREIKLPQKVVHAHGAARVRQADAPSDYSASLAQLMPLSEILPRQPKIAERTTGEVMGESAERMARINEITREAQDEFAARSHQRAAAAIAAGRFDGEITQRDDAGRRVGCTTTASCAPTPASRSSPS